MALRSIAVPKGERRRLVEFLPTVLPGVSAEHARRLVVEGRVRIGGKVAKAQRKLWGGEAIEIDFPEPKTVARAEGPPVPVLHEDARLLIVDKPPGVVVEPDGVNPSLVELLATQRRGFDVAGVAAPGVVHRLDRDTSGCVVLAKTDEASAELTATFEGKQVDKRYLAIVLGNPADTAALDTPFGRDPVDPRLFSSKVPSARRARLTYKVTERFPDAALLEVTLDTGRTHQIRVQLADAGLPVLGDPVYGPHDARRHPAALELGRVALHAVSLRLELPSGVVQATAPTPPDFERALDLLRKGGMSPGP